MTKLRTRAKGTCVCGETASRLTGECDACYRYKLRTGDERPQHLYAKECANCGTKKARRYVKGICIVCYDYQWKRDGDVRPAELWCKNLVVAGNIRELAAWRGRVTHWGQVEMGKAIHITTLAELSKFSRRKDKMTLYLVGTWMWSSDGKDIAWMARVAGMSVINE